MKLRSLLAACVSALLFVSSAAPAFAAAGVTADLTAKFSGTFAGTNDLGTPVFPFELKKLTQVAPGTASGLADLIFSDERTLAASATENLDLAGALTSPLGATLTFAKVKAILVVADAANTNSVCVGGAASNTFNGPFSDATDIVCLKPGGVLMVTADPGWTVTASTGDILKVANSSSGTGVTYKVIIIGASA